jgi:hypothetical protein
MSDSQNQGMGCFAKGCLTLIIVCVLLVACALGGGYYLLRSSIDKYTSDKPVAIRVEQPTDVQMSAAAAKARALTEAYNAGKEVTVELTGPDINALIARNPNYAKYRGTIYFAIANSDLSADVSFPLEVIPYTMFKGRYFNGHFITFFEWNNGDLTIKPKLIEANGSKVPDMALDKISAPDSQVKFNAELRKQQNHGLREELDRFKSIRVVDDRLIIVTKARDPATK